MLVSVHRQQEKTIPLIIMQCDKQANTWYATRSPEPSETEADKGPENWIAKIVNCNSYQKDRKKEKEKAWNRM